MRARTSADIKRWRKRKWEQREEKERRKTKTKNIGEIWNQNAKNLCLPPLHYFSASTFEAYVFYSALRLGGGQLLIAFARDPLLCSWYFLLFSSCHGRYHARWNIFSLQYPPTPLLICPRSFHKSVISEPLNQSMFTQIQNITNM